MQYMETKVKYLKETTVWNSPIPNHTYIINSVDWCVGYIKLGNSSPTMFSKPLKTWSKSRRKFLDVTGEYS